MSVNKFGEHYIARYTAYLNDVLNHFKTHRSLRKYSYIAQAHKITHMNTDVFQETELYQWVDKPLTREKVIEVIKSVDAHDSRKKKKESPQEHKFKDGEVLSTFIDTLTRTRDKIKEKYPEVKDTDITVEFENNVDNLPMSLTFSALETDEEYAERLVEEEERHLANKNRILKEFKRCLKEYPDIMQELLKDL